VRVDDRRDAAAIAGGNRAQHRLPASRLLLDALEDDDVGVGRPPDSQDQPRYARQGQRDRDQLDQREEEHPVDREPDYRDQAQEAGVDEQEEADDEQPDDAGLVSL